VTDAETLDDVPGIESMDKGDMARALSGFPSQLRLGTEPDVLSGFTRTLSDRMISNVAICGMGGSAISGDIIEGWIGSRCGVPLATVRGYRLPGWVDEKTLVICVSYSGNTEETLANAREAEKRGCALAAVCSGGRLADFFDGKGPVLGVPPNQQPRASSGWLLCRVADLLISAQVTSEGLAEDIREAREILEQMEKELSVNVPTDSNSAKDMAIGLQGRIPAIYGAEHLTVAARRWQTQINENGKVLAWWGSFPEMNHNEIVGWAGGDLSQCTAIFLRDDGYHPQIHRRMDYTRDVIVKGGGAVREVSSLGSGHLARVLSTVYVGDWVSFYMAMLRGLDPSPVEVIEGLKVHLASK